MMNAINPKKQIAPMRHVTTVPIMIRLRATLLSKNLPTMKARRSKVAMIAAANNRSLDMQHVLTPAKSDFQ
jgi:hypothetical protein